MRDHVMAGGTHAFPGALLVLAFGYVIADSGVLAAVYVGAVLALQWIIWPAEWWRQSSINRGDV